MKHPDPALIPGQLTYLAARMQRSICPTSPVVDTWAEELREVAKQVERLHEALHAAELLAGALHHVRETEKGLNQCA